MVRSAVAAFAIPVLRHAIAERVSAKMSGLAQKIDGRLLITILELAVRRAHAAKRLNLAAIANRRARARLVANLAQGTFPAFEETALANVVALLMRNDANAHQAVGIDGAARHSPAARVFLTLPGPRLERCGQLFLSHTPIVFFAF